jgi:hypothetical protein
VSDRVTWESCPSCARPAAVGWIDGHPVEFDCPRGCSLSTDQLTAVFARGSRQRINGD